VSIVRIRHDIAMSHAVSTLDIRSCCVLVTRV
jgi:hypothetical protein